MSVIRSSFSGPSGLQAKCAAALSQWEDLEEPAAIEEALIAFLPKDQPLRDEAIDTLAKV